jgi:hypothetical protein
MDSPLPKCEPEWTLDTLASACAVCGQRIERVWFLVTKPDRVVVTCSELCRDDVKAGVTR